MAESAEAQADSDGEEGLEVWLHYVLIEGYQLKQQMTAVGARLRPRSCIFGVGKQDSYAARRSSRWRMRFASACAIASRSLFSLASMVSSAHCSYSGMRLW